MPLVHDLARYRAWPQQAQELARLLADGQNPSCALLARCTSFMQRFDPRRDGLWTVMPAAQPVATLALAGREVPRIEWLHVAHSWRRRGLARALWQRASQFVAVNGGTILELDLRLDAPAAMAFAGSVGCHPHGPVRTSPTAGRRQVWRCRAAGA